MARHILLGFLLICELITQNSCVSKGLIEQRNDAEAGLDAICKEIPVPSDFRYVRSEKTLDIGKVAISKNYKSNIPCTAVGDHFRNYFIQEGWDPNRMLVAESRGGMATLDFDFRNGEYLVSVACENRIGDEAEKQISQMCSWGFR